MSSATFRKSSAQYESRHIHAVKRPRGAGGIFLPKEKYTQAVNQPAERYINPELIVAEERVKPPKVARRETKYAIKDLNDRQKIVLSIIADKLKQCDFLVPCTIIEETFRDSFLWNMTETMRLQDWVEWYCLDRGIEARAEKRILAALQDQIINYQNVFLVKLIDQDLKETNLVKDRDDVAMLVPITLDVRIESIQLKDQFEWDLSNKDTPSEFARQLVVDLKLDKEFVPLICYSIYEQLTIHMQSILEGTYKTKRGFGEFADIIRDDTVIRDEYYDESWAPYVKRLTMDDVKEMQIKQSRSQRLSLRKTNNKILLE